MGSLYLGAEVLTKKRLVQASAKHFFMKVNLFSKSTIRTWALELAVEQAATALEENSRLENSFRLDFI